LVQLESGRFSFLSSQFGLHLALIFVYLPLTGFYPENVFPPSIMGNREKRMGFFFNEGLALALTPIMIGFIYAFMILPTLGSSNKLGVILLIIVPLTVIVGRALWRKKPVPTH
jgi:hypothetical protein